MQVRSRSLQNVMAKLVGWCVAQGAQTNKLRGVVYSGLSRQNFSGALKPEFSHVMRTRTCAGLHHVHLSFFFPLQLSNRDFSLDAHPHVFMAVNVGFERLLGVCM